MSELLGWRTTRWGMSANDVLSVMGDEIVRTDRQDFEGFYSDMIVPNSLVGEYVFEALLQMRTSDGRLGRVIVRHTADLMSPPNAVRSAVASILSERFGPPQRIGTTDVSMTAESGPRIFR